MSKKLSEDEFFITLAFLASGRSKDGSSQVGACIALKDAPKTPHHGGTNPPSHATLDQYLVSVGYNGMPNGSSFKDAEMTWTKPGKNSFVCHAEMNAIFSAFQHNAHLHHYYSTLYVTHSPCEECCKLVIQYKIDKVVYKNNYHFGNDVREFLSKKRVERYDKERKEDTDTLSCPIGQRIVIKLKENSTSVETCLQPDIVKPQKENRMKRSDLTLDGFFMAVALLATRRLYTKDDHTPKEKVAEVGACLVSADPKRIISIGHSHKICDDDNTSKLDISAASDAIANAQKFNADLNNTTLYITKPLDSECAKKVVQAGIKCVKCPAASNPVMKVQHQLVEKYRDLIREEEEQYDKIESEDPLMKLAEKIKISYEIKAEWDKIKEGINDGKLLPNYEEMKSALAVKEVFNRAEIPYMEYSPHIKERNICMQIFFNSKALRDLEQDMASEWKETIRGCEKVLGNREAVITYKKALENCVDALRLESETLDDTLGPWSPLMTACYDALKKCEKVCRKDVTEDYEFCKRAYEFCTKAFEDDSWCYLED